MQLSGGTVETALLTVNDVSKRLNVGKTAAYHVMSVQLADRVVRIGKLIRVPADALESYILYGGDKWQGEQK